jgi:hypothetical protein
VVKENEMGRCKDALVKAHTAGGRFISVTDLITQRSHGKTFLQAGYATVDVAADRAHPAGTADHRGAVMDGEIGWIMSSRSTGNGGSCVQARCHAGWIEVRNSKSPEAGTVRFTAEEWDSFLDGAKKGEFDRLLAG